MKPILFLSAAILCYSCNSGSAKFNKVGLDSATQTYNVTQEDSEMNNAIKMAKDSLALFDQAIESRDSNYTNFAVKKKYNTPNDGGEHMWIANIKIVDGKYKGVVNNDAEATTEVKYGDTVFVNKNDITDWMYVDNGVLRGGYTLRVIANKLKPAERAQFEQESGFKIQ